MAEREAAAAGRAGGWFVQAAGRVWGPYPDARLEAFVVEGRVAGETLVSPSADGPFVPAARQARLRRLFLAGASTVAAPRPEVSGAAAPVEAATAMRAPVYEPAPAKALLVWAGLRSEHPERFQQLLAAYGPLVRLGADLWLVRVRMGPAAFRNALSRRLQSEDALMVVDAPLDHVAWFNLSLEADRTVRQLWLEG